MSTTTDATQVEAFHSQCVAHAKDQAHVGKAAYILQHHADWRARQVRKMLGLGFARNQREDQRTTGS